MRRTVAFAIFSCAGALVAFTAQTSGQEHGTRKELPEAPQAKPARVPSKHENRLHTSIEILGRRSIFFPDLAATRGPLGKRQKFEIFLDDSIAPSRMTTASIGAGIRQASNSFPGYGQEFGGYGKRFGASMATSASSNLFGKFLFSSAWHQDPRYFVSLHGGAGSRMGYALSRIVVGRKDSGDDAPNWPGLLGPLLAESLANSYLPEREMTAGRTFERYGLRIGFTAAGNILKEYWPTIFRSLRISKIAPSAAP